jgi:hypothetical protein
MKHHRGSVGRAVVATLLLGIGVAHADPIALDYHAKVDGCPAADRFGDEVAAKLGFVPWDPQAPVAIRVRIDHDSGDFVGSIEQPDGTSKILRAASCAKLDELLVSALAVVLDKTTEAPPPPPAPEDERRLRKLERPEPERDQRLTLRFHAKDDRPLAISRVESATTSAIQTHYGAAVGTAITLDPLCKAPCDAKLPPGDYAFVAQDIGTPYSAAAEATVRVNSILELDYKSHAAQRSSARHRPLFGALIGLVVGAAATAIVLENTSKLNTGTFHALLDPLGALTGASIGEFVGILTRPRDIYDELAVTVRPGLADQ